MTVRLDAARERDELLDLCVPDVHRRLVRIRPDLTPERVRAHLAELVPLEVPPALSVLTVGGKP